MFPIRARRIRYYREKLFSRLIRKPPVVKPIEVVLRMDQGKGFDPIAAEGQAASAAPAASAAATLPGYGEGAKLARAKGKAARLGAPAAAKAGTASASKPAGSPNPASLTTDPSIPDGSAPDGFGEAGPSYDDLFYGSPPDDVRGYDGPAPRGSAAADVEQRQPAMQPHQADGLLASIAGTKVDLTGLGLVDGKAAVAAFLNIVPTVASLNLNRRSIAAE